MFVLKLSVLNVLA